MAKAHGELVGHGAMNVDDVANEINGIYNAQLRNEISAVIQLGILFNTVKDKLPHGDFDLWCDRNFDFSRTTRAKWMAIAIFDGYAQKKLQIDICESKWNISALYELVSKKCPDEAKKQLALQLKKGEIVSKAGVLEVVKSFKAPKPSPSADDDEDDGRIDCLRCGERFERAEFHDPDAPVNCRSCHDAATEELDEEDAAKASEEIREGKPRHRAEPVSLTSAWGEAAESDRHAMVQAASDEGYCSVGGVTEVLCEIAEEKPDRSSKEVLDEAWANCTEKVQRAWLKVNKIKAKFFLSRFVPPTREEVQEHVDKNGYSIDAEEFIAHYETNGWKVGVGGNPMKSWKTACTTWQKRRDKDKRAANNGADMDNDEFRS